MERSRWDISDVTILVVCTPDVLKKKSGSEIRPRGCVILCVTILYRNIMTVWNKYWCTNGHYIWGQSGIRYGWWYTWYGKLQRYIARTPRKHTNYSSCCCDHMNSWLQCSPCSQDRLQQLWSGRLPQEENKIKTEDDKTHQLKQIVYLTAANGRWFPPSRYTGMNRSAELIAIHVSWLLVDLLAKRVFSWWMSWRSKEADWRIPTWNSELDWRIPTWNKWAKWQKSPFVKQVSWWIPIHWYWRFRANTP